MMILGGGLLSLTTPSGERIWWLTVGAGGFVLFGVYVLLSLWASVLRIYPDRLEVREITRTDVIRREDVFSYDIGPAGRSGALQLSLFDRHKKVWRRIPMIFEDHGDLFRWLHSPRKHKRAQ